MPAVKAPIANSTWRCWSFRELPHVFLVFFWFGGEKGSGISSIHVFFWRKCLAERLARLRRFERLRQKEGFLAESFVVQLSIVGVFFSIKRRLNGCA